MLTIKNLPPGIATNNGFKICNINKESTAKNVSFSGNSISTIRVKSLSQIKKSTQKLVDSSFHNFSGVVTGFSKFKAKKDPVSVEELQRIRNGISGVIRPAEELSSKDLMKVINNELMITSPEDISKVVNSFNWKDRVLATRAMQRLTQFGNYQSLNKLVDNAKACGGAVFFKNEEISLLSTLKYLQKKGNYQNIKFNSSGNTVILDSEMLEKLKKQPSLSTELKERGAKFVYPEGWINGMNPFNQTADLHSMTSTVVNKAKKFMQNGERISIDSAIDKVINESILKDIKELGLQNNFKIIQNTAALRKDPTYVQIAKQLKPDKIKLDNIDDMLHKLPKEYQQIALENLSQNIILYSPKKLAVKLQEMHKQICPDGNIDGVSFYVPNLDRSYGIMALQYKMVNNIPSSHMIIDYDAKTIEKAKKLVVLDDVSGSGESLRSSYSTLRNCNNSEIIFAPVIIADTAAKEYRKLSTKDSNFTFLENNFVKSPKRTDYFKSLSTEDQMKFSKLLQDTGCCMNGLNLAFPHMTPDNNNRFFSNLIAKYFTHNGNGVKLCGNGFKPTPFSFQELNKPLPTTKEEITDLIIF